MYSGALHQGAPPYVLQSYTRGRKYHIARGHHHVSVLGAERSDTGDMEGGVERGKGMREKGTGEKITGQIEGIL